MKQCEEHCPQHINIREKLVEYGEGHDDILSIGFLTKIEEATKNVRHLVVLEFPENYSTEQMKVHMEAIFKEINPLAKEIKQIEYAVKGRIKAIDDIVAQHKDQMVIYSQLGDFYVKSGFQRV